MSNRLFLAAVLLCASLTGHAQSGAYTSYAPYSIFGLGNLSDQGTAYNRTMGGVGIASRDNRYINPLNPASITARDSLSFMADFSLYQGNSYFTQNTSAGMGKSVFNTFNMNDIVMSFPIYRQSAMMIGLSPYSSTGYSNGWLETNPDLIGASGNITHSFTGQGSLYQLYIAGAATFWKKLSIGAEYIHYFGNTEKKYEMSVSGNGSKGISQGTILQLSSNTYKLGVQYEQRLSKDLMLGLGATYRGKAILGGYDDNYINSGTLTIYEKLDTLLNVSNKVSIADEIGLGISINYMDKLRAEFDYTRSSWSGSGLDSFAGFKVEKAVGVPLFTCTTAESFRIGIEYIPNRNDIRYYMKKVAYRAGGYYRKEYYLVDGRPVYAAALTLGATLPVFRWHNGFTVGVELGQRGSLNNGMIRERFVNFTIGVNIFDFWFHKRVYE